MEKDISQRLLTPEASARIRASSSSGGSLPRFGSRNGTSSSSSFPSAAIEDNFVDPNRPSPLARLGLAVLACWQNSLIGGLVYGWASLIPMLTTPIDDAVNAGAGLTLTQTTIIFSWASGVGMVSTLLLGYLLDRYGPRVCSVVSHLSVAMGCQLFAFCDRYTTFCVATCLISFGGPGIQVSIVHLTNLFPKNRFLALSLLNGTISFSFAIFPLFEWLWDNAAVPYQALFGALSVLTVASTALSILVWPDKGYEAPLLMDAASKSPILETTPEDDYIEATANHQHLFEQPLSSYLRSDPSHQIERHDSYVFSKKAMERGYMKLVSLKDQPFHKQLLSSTYLRIIGVFVTTCFLANFYVASIATELADLAEFAPRDQEQLVRIFTLIMSGGVVASLIIGIVMDHAGLEAATALTLVLGMSHMAVLAMFGDRWYWMIFGFCLYVLFRQLLFPVGIAAMTARLGYKYFGILNGIGFLISGVAQLFMAYLVKAIQGTCHLLSHDDYAKGVRSCDHGSWVGFHYVEIVIVGLLLLLPLYDYRAMKQHKEQVAEMQRKSPSWRLLLNGSSPSLGRYGSIEARKLEAAEEEKENLDDSETNIGLEF